MFPRPQLAPGAKRPNPVWALCTSATRAYAQKALAAAGIAPPEIFVAAEDVQQGKPAYAALRNSFMSNLLTPLVDRPDPYLLGAKFCGVDPARCLVVEDAPAGIKSGQAAGCKTLGVITSHTREQIEAAKPTYLVKNLAR